MLIAGRSIEGIGLGTAQFAFRDGTTEDSVATVHAALDAGVRLIDTMPEAALAVARRRGVSVHRVLLAWLREQSPNIMPLVGASRPASIRDSAAPLDLADSDLEDLRTAYGQCMSSE